MKKIHKFLFSREKVINLDRISARSIKCQYAVRGFIPLKAAEIEKDLKKNPDNYNFQKIARLNIGNPQSFN